MSVELQDLQGPEQRADKLPTDTAEPPRSPTAQSSITDNRHESQTSSLSLDRTQSDGIHLEKLSIDNNIGDKPAHHLTRHWLQDGSKGDAAIERLGATDAKTAEKLIRTLGQRDLRQAFQRVYGSETQSFNNNWLRRKLYEAVGLPRSTSTKTSRAIKRQRSEALKLQTAESEAAAAEALASLMG